LMMIASTCSRYMNSTLFSQTTIKTSFRWQFLEEYLVFLKEWREAISNKFPQLTQKERARMFLSVPTYKGIETTGQSNH
jgi:hypothetical protein